MSEVDWPDGFDRTDTNEREAYPHGFRVSQREAFENILTQLQRLGVEEVKIDSGAEHQTRNPNLPYADATADGDPAVVVYYTKNGEDFAVPCDRWDNIRDNAQAIAKYLDAKRALDRYGVETMESEFSTQKLPPGDDETDHADPTVAPPADDHEPPHDVLGVERDADESEVREAFRQRVQTVHPDHGGSEAEFQRVRNAREAMLDE